MATEDTVTFVNRFTVTCTPEKFEQIFAETSAFMAGRDGFLGNLLLRHVEQDGNYVNIARWRDEEAFRRAVSDPLFRPHAAALRAVSTSEPNLYRARQAFRRPRGA